MWMPRTMLHCKESSSQAEEVQKAIWTQPSTQSLSNVAGRDATPMCELPRQTTDLTDVTSSSSSLPNLNNFLVSSFIRYRHPFCSVTPCSSTKTVCARFCRHVLIIAVFMNARAWRRLVANALRKNGYEHLANDNPRISPFLLSLTFLSQVS